MTRPLPTNCPLCAGPIHVARITCERCACSVEGHFSLDWLVGLSPEQLQFVKVFLMCRGKIKDVEQALGISYPTVVSRLDAVVAAVGGVPVTSEARPLDVLDQLASGDIDVDEAERLLRNTR